MKVAIFIDVGFRVGFGHLKRAMVLGLALQKAGFSVFLVACRGLEHVSRVNFPVFVSSDLSALATFLKDIDILIVDAPVFPAELREYSLINKNLKLLIGIDEMSPLRDELDIHFCTTLGGLQNRVIKRGKSWEYFGPRYFVFGLLKDGKDGDSHQNMGTGPKNFGNFGDRPPSKTWGQAPKHGDRHQNYDGKKNSGQGLLFSFGGSDPAFITELFSELLVQIAPQTFLEGRFVGIIGPGFVETRTKNLQDKFAGVKWQKNLNDLTSLYLNSFHVFCSGGLSAYEALKCGALPICIAQQDEQLSVIESLASYQLALCIGKYDNINIKLLENCLLRPYDYEDFRAKAVSVFYELCEGMRGEERIVNIIKEHILRRDYVI